jgi:hypothetical protein
MSGHYAANPHYAPDDFSEERERFERCEEQAGAWFASATVTQTAIWHRALSDLRGLSAPRYDRAREAANAEFHRTTAAARELCDLTVQELMTTGEISEALSYRWDELNVAGAMLEAAE